MACILCRNHDSNPPKSLSGIIVYTCSCGQKWKKEKNQWKKDEYGPWVSNPGKHNLSIFSQKIV
jgi:hypothetical protein